MFLMRSSVSRTIIDDCVKANLLECAKLEDGDETPVCREWLYSALLTDLLEQANAEGICVQVAYDTNVTSENLTVTSDATACDSCGELCPNGELTDFDDGTRCPQCF